MGQEQTVKAGRLAFRVEGNMWNCYYALPDTMEDAIFIAGIQMAIVDDKKHKETFMQLMRDGLELIFKEKNIVVSKWLTEKAPEHERGQ